MTAGAKMESSPTKKLDTTSSIENLQTKEQQLVLDTVSQIRKCGLDSILELPQICVCGDQSAGKSSVLEALTEIPFPRADNLCTRFATEIILRNSPQDALTIKVIPDASRQTSQQDSIRNFQETITDFSQLPEIMDKAKSVMGVDNDDGGFQGRAFAKDVLSIEIAGPTRPQLTLVDLPGLIQSQSKGVSKEDVELVHDLTDRYISQDRTICLAVIAATNDFSNQSILDKVRTQDPEGERSLGIITKPDRLSAGSGSETSFIELAQNEDVFFKLGWHVLKNRAFENSDDSFSARNASEADFFQKSNFKVLPPDSVGINALRERLSVVLFEHIKRELPKLRQDLTRALDDTARSLEQLGRSRGDTRQCRDYLMQLSQDYRDVCKSAVDGHYEGKYFVLDPGEVSYFSSDNPKAIRRLRAMVQALNMEFANNLRTKGHTFQIKMAKNSDDDNDTIPAKALQRITYSDSPIAMSRSDALSWINQTLVQNRGRELQGNYNPLIIGELFRTQSHRWGELAEAHLEKVANVCTRFLNYLLQEKCPKDVHHRLWSSQIDERLQEKRTAALKELEKIMDDLQVDPINYNHYYTDTVQKARQQRMTKGLSESITDATKHIKLDGCTSSHTSAQVNTECAADNFARRIDPNMENVSCEELIDCLLAIYKVMQKTFLANITTQVIERHIIRGLDQIFSPTTVNRLSDETAENLVSEPTTAKRQRGFYEDRLSKLKNGQKILRGVMGSAGV